MPAPFGDADHDFEEIMREGGIAVERVAYSIVGDLLAVQRGERVV